MEQLNINIEYIQNLEKYYIVLIDISLQILFYIFTYMISYSESSLNENANDKFNRIIINQHFITLVSFFYLFLTMFLLYLLNKQKYINVITYINAFILFLDGLFFIILYAFKVMFFAI